MEKSCKIIGRDCKTPKSEKNVPLYARMKIIHWKSMEETRSWISLRKILYTLKKFNKGLIFNFVNISLN
jgi:hypothetical protein